MPDARIGNHLIRYRERGAGFPAMMLVHGAGASSLCFSELLNRLGQRCRAVALDLPGHGNSGDSTIGPADVLLHEYCEVVAALAEKLGLGRYVLVGHSMGGAVGQHVALHYPDRLAALVLIATGIRLQVSEPLRALLAHHFEQLPDFLAAQAYSPATDRQKAERWAAAQIQAPQQVTVADFEACNVFDLRGQLAGISCPALVIGGADDRITPPSMQAELAAQLPRARVEILSRAGHQVLWERSDVVAELVDAWRLGARRPSGAM